jgi:aubergine-like protein
LWPGYVTSIRQHEDEILLCCEISHKVLRQETLLDILRGHLHDDSSSFKERFAKEVVGSVALTAYNNRTYRIDDVDWSKNASSTFPYNGRDISFIDYYREKYSISIRDAKQPLLISNPSVRLL